MTRHPLPLLANLTRWERGGISLRRLLVKEAKPMQCTIEFRAVGRAKRTWCRTFERLPPPWEIADEAKAALMSSNVHAVWRDDAGGFIAAGLHTVGEFRVINAPADAQQTIPETKP